MAQKVVLNATLSPDSFKELSKVLKTMANTTLQRYSNRMITLGLRQLKKNATKNVTERVGLTGYEPTGDLAHSFSTVRHGKKVGLIINTHENAAAVEFGTGITGSQAPHPVANEKGWNYGDKEGWVYNDGHEFWYTRGQTGKRFMYDALIEFKESGQMREVAIQAFNDIILKEVKQK
jgi:hypothetical protein